MTRYLYKVSITLAASTAALLMPVCAQAQDKALSPAENTKPATRVNYKSPPSEELIAQQLKAAALTPKVQSAPLLARRSQQTLSKARKRRKQREIPF